MTSEPSATETASTGQLSALNINVGANVTELRENKHLSMYDVAKAMKKLGHSWSKTTLFNIEHNSRRLQAVEAFDLLRCMGYHPETDLMLLYRDSPSQVDLSIEDCAFAGHKCEACWSVYRKSRKLAEASLDEATQAGTITKERADNLRINLRTWEQSFGHADHRQQLPVAFAEIAHGFPHRYAGARTLKAEPAPPSRPAWIHPDTERAPWFEHCE